MLIAALCSLVAGAIAGVFLASRHFLRKRLPAWGALLHGVGGAVGFLLVLLTVVNEPSFRAARTVLDLLIATIGLGCVNLLFHVRRVRHRASLIVMHGLCAASAVVTLVVAIASHEPASCASCAASQGPPKVAPAASPRATTDADRPATSVATTTAPPTDRAAPAAIDPATRAVLGRTIHFETASAAVRTDSMDDVSAIASALVAHPEITLVEVQGHADERGDDARNVELTRQRASVVASALADHGVARGRVHVAGYGSRCQSDPECQSGAPAGSCHDAAQWQRDRRVVVVVLAVGGQALHAGVVCDRGADLIPDEDRAYR